jgi:hypothetical protein
MAWDCAAYYDYLFDRTPHFDQQILKDWFPTDDAWVGKIKTENWEAFTGTQHVRDRVHIGFPDISGCWQRYDVQNQTCVSGACNPPTKSVGWGSTRSTYDRERQSYQTNVLCFDQILTRAAARQQLTEIVAGVKLITKIVQSDYLRRQALQKNTTIYLAGATRTEVDVVDGTFNADCTEIALGSAYDFLTSQLTMQYLQRFYEPLQLEGYFKSKYVPNGMFMLKTDPITSQQLSAGNPDLTSKYRFTDFAKGGELFKYGAMNAVGNFAIEMDEFPMRFYPVGGGRLKRVFPYDNISATIGIKRRVSTQYLNAPIQVSYVWHPEAMFRYVPQMVSVNPDMPFMTRDLGGAWKFFGPGSGVIKTTDPVTGDECVVDNKRGNQGLWFADFENAIEMQRPELTRAILHLREPGCVTDMPACSTAPAYTEQDYSDSNPVCED